MRIVTLMLAACLTLAALPAAAQVGTPTPGFLYFHRPGATMAEHDTAMRGCTRDALSALGHYLGFGPVGAPAQGLLGSALQGESNRNQIQANIETCMVVRGWSAVRPLGNEEPYLLQASQASLIAYLEPRVGSSEPRGTVVRRWDPGAPLLYKTGVFPKAQETLSFVAVFGPFGAQTRLPAGVGLKPNWRARGRTADPGKILPGATLIVVRTHGDRPGQQMNPRFMNIEEREGQEPALDLFSTPTPTKMFWKAGTPMETLYVFEVPAGRWILMGDNGATFCLRAPVFDVGEGEVVFAGTFSSAVAGDMQPKMDMAPAKAGLPPAIADRMRPAAWRNGATFDCGLVPSSFLNALEIKGAPAA